MRRSAFVTVFFMCLALSVSNLQAKDIEIAITAEITEIHDGHGFINGLSVGDTITGSYIYDSNTPDSGPSNEIHGLYEHASPPYGITLYAGGFVFRTDPNNVDFDVQITNDLAGYKDGYYITSYKNLPLYDNVIVEHIYWQLADLSCTALSSDALPTTPPVLTDWIDLDIRIIGGFPRQHKHFLIGADVISVELVPARIDAGVDIDPDTLNLASKGKWLTCYIRLPEEYDVADIDPNTVILQNEQRYVVADWLWFDEGEEYAMAKFSRQELQEILEPGEDVELTITGQLTDGTRFEGTDTIRVIDKGGRK